MPDADTTILSLRQRIGAFVAERDWAQFHNAKDLAAGSPADLEVDGGIKPANIASVASAGATIAVVGSAVPALSPAAATMPR